MKRDWLKEKRTQKGLTLKGAARELGVSFSHYSKIEEGYATPHPQLAMKIAHEWGFNWTKFFQED